MNPYIRAASKFPKVKQQAKERLSKRPGDKTRAREADGTFKGDDPTTPVVNEAWTRKKP